MPGLELDSVTHCGVYCLVGKEGDENSVIGVAKALKQAVQGTVGAHGRGFSPGFRHQGKLHRGRYTNQNVGG